jgi:capsular exopolysaccharide synthesis family protein
MSNIFDALRRKQNQEGDVKTQLVPGGAEITPLLNQPTITPAPEIDFHQVRELETLRERIETSIPRSGRRVLGLASSVTGEGASTVGLKLARIMARSSDRKVLLVDADLSRSPQTLSLAVRKELLPGLTEVLIGTVDFAHAVLPTDEPNLHFLPSGREVLRPMDAFSSERMRQFLDEMARIYRIVLLDCPAILEHPEVPVIGSLTDGIVLVVRANRTRREVAQKALAILHESRCRVLGVVLNQRRYPIPGFLYRRL